MQIYTQALKDTFPYFLGAVDDEYVRKREELRRLRDQLRGVERQLAELNSIRGDGVGKAFALLAQARDAGLSSVITDSWQETIAALRQAVMVTLGHTGELPDGDEYRRLSDSRSVLLQEQRSLKDEMEAVRAFERDANGYSREATEQHSRLVSIGVFDDAAPGHSCPLCAQALPESGQQPEIAELRGRCRLLLRDLNLLSRTLHVLNAPRVMLPSVWIRRAPP